MRETEARFWMLQTSSLSRALRFAAIALGVGLVMAAGPVRAGDDEDEDDKTFEEKIIEGIMRGIGGTNMENRGIEYRERSPLVVPPKLDLPPPAGATPQGGRRGAQEREQGPARTGPHPDTGRARGGQDRGALAQGQRSGAARHLEQQSDPEPVAARL
jgi:hypothetical protein